MGKKSILVIIAIFLLLIFILLVFWDRLMGFDIFAIKQYRLPRIPLIIILGAGTSTSGVLIQKLTKNNLADSGLIGIADAGLVILSIISILSPLLLNTSKSSILFSAVIPTTIFVSSFLTMFFIYFLSRINGGNSKKIILMGLGMHMFLQALASGIIYFNNGYTNSIFLRYLIGFIEKKPPIIWITSLIGISIVILISIFLSFRIDLISAGEKFAKSRGVNEKIIILILFVLIALSVSFTVSSVGNVAVLGLVAPNIARKIVGQKTIKLLPTSILIGILATALAQFININLLHLMAPIAILIQLGLAPYFIILLLKKQKG